MPSSVSVRLDTTNVGVTPSGQVAVAVTTLPPLSVTVGTPTTQEIVTTSDEVVSVQELSLKGEKGDRGQDGIVGRDGLDGQGAPFIFDQPNASLMWHIVHGKGSDPSIVVRRTDGVTLGAFGVVYSEDRNTADLYFGVPTSGTATLDF